MIRIVILLPFLFVFLSCSNYKAEITKVFYCGVNEGVGFFERELKGADAVSFKILDGGNFAKDKHHVWLGECTLDSANPDAFRVLNTYCGVDDKYLYCGGSKVKVTSPSTIRWLCDRYFMDSKDVYFLDFPMNVKNINKFEIIKLPTYEVRKSNIISRLFLFIFRDTSSDWSRDSENYYFEGQLVNGIDYNSFKILSVEFMKQGYTKDKAHVFYANMKIETVSLDSFTYIKYGWARDDIHVYYKGEVVESADSKTFKASETDNFTCEDKNGFWAYGEKKAARKKRTVNIAPDCYHYSPTSAPFLPFVNGSGVFELNSGGFGKSDL